jgi:hypothetical protein
VLQQTWRGIDPNFSQAQADAFTEALSRCPDGVMAMLLPLSRARTRARPSFSPAAAAVAAAASARPPPNAAATRADGGVAEKERALVSTLASPPEKSSPQKASPPAAATPRWIKAADAPALAFQRPKTREACAANSARASPFAGLKFHTPAPPKPPALSFRPPRNEREAPKSAPARTFAGVRAFGVDLPALPTRRLDDARRPKKLLQSNYSAPVNDDERSDDDASSSDGADAFDAAWDRRDGADPTRSTSDKGRTAKSRVSAVPGFPSSEFRGERGGSHAAEGSRRGGGKKTATPKRRPRELSWL